MSARVAVVALAAMVAGCKAKPCEEISVVVSVIDPNGLTISDAEVMMLGGVGSTATVEYPCPSAGDGTYDCTVPEPGEYNVYVEPVIPIVAPYYETYGLLVEVPEPDPKTCDEPALVHEAILRFESGGA